MTNIEFNEERFDIPHGVDDEILNTLLDRIAKYTVEQNQPPNINNNMNICTVKDKDIKDEIMDYNTRIHNRKVEEDNDKEHIAQIIADTLNIPITSISVYDSEIIIDTNKAI